MYQSSQTCGIRLIIRLKSTCPSVRRVFLVLTMMIYEEYFWFYYWYVYRQNVLRWCQRVMQLIFGHRHQSVSGRGEWGTTLRRNVVSHWLGPWVGWPLQCCYHRLIQQTWRFKIIFSFQFKTGLYVDFLLYIQIVNSMYYFTSFEVSWLVHVADWWWPLRKSITYLSKDGFCWLQVMDSCLPFLKLLWDKCHRIVLMINQHWFM